MYDQGRGVQRHAPPRNVMDVCFILSLSDADVTEMLPPFDTMDEVAAAVLYAQEQQGPLQVAEKQLQPGGEQGPLEITDGESTYTMLYTYKFMDVCFILSLSDADLNLDIFEQQQTEDAAGRELEGFLIEALGPLPDVSHVLEPPLHPSPKPPSLCQVPGCGYRVKCMWNHLFQYHQRGQCEGPHTCPVRGCGRTVTRLYNHHTKFHKKHRMTGKFIHYCADCTYLYCSLQSWR